MLFNELDKFYHCVHLLYLIFVTPRSDYRNTYKKELYRIINKVNKPGSM